MANTEFRGPVTVPTHTHSGYVADSDPRLSDARTPTAHVHSGADITSGTVPYGRLPVGTSTGTVAAGDDARLSDARTPTAHAHSGADITTGTVPYARLPVGTTASTVAAGNDSRLSDARTPLAHTHVRADVTDLQAALDAKANVALNVRTMTTGGAIADTDDVILCDTTSAAFTVTLPSAIGRTGRDFLIKKVGANALTIATTSSQTIDGVTTEVISMTQGFREVVSDGANWRIRGGKVDPVITQLASITTGNIAVNAAQASVYRITVTGATCTLVAPTQPVDGDVVNVEVWPGSSQTVMTVDPAIVLTGGITSPITIPANKLLSVALRYRAATSPATATAAWRLLASSPDN